MDPHQNIFFYYGSPSKNKDKNDSTQIENNTTKALINTLENLEVRNAILLLEKILDERLPNTTNLKFSLQTIPLNIKKQRIKRAIVLLPPFGTELTVKRNRSNIQGRPDGWIFNDNFVIFVETKTNLRTYNSNQLISHFRNNKISWDANKPKLLHVCHFDKFFIVVKEFYEKHKHSHHLSLKELFLIESLIKYLEIIGMNSFEGYNNKHFFSVNAIRSEQTNEFEDFFYDEKYLKNYFALYTDELQKKLKSESGYNWKKHIYLVDKKQKRFYNHFCPQKKNNHNLNINTSFNQSGMRVSMWIPLYKGVEGEKKSIQGKINQNKLVKTFNTYRNKKEINELIEKFCGLFKSLKFTYQLDLESAQFLHKKGSQKRAQGQQKKPSTLIMSIGVGSNIITEIHSKKYVLDQEYEVYDTAKDLTKYLSAGKNQLTYFFNLVFELLSEGDELDKGPLENLKRYQLVVSKELPMSYVVNLSSQKLTKLITQIVLDIKKVLDLINDL